MTLFLGFDAHCTNNSLAGPASNDGAVASTTFGPDGSFESSATEVISLTWRTLNGLSFVWPNDLERDSFMYSRLLRANSRVVWTMGQR